MTQDIKDLIEKINQEGIMAADGKAREIESQAKRKAEEALEKAKKEAEIIIAEAKEKIALMEEKERALLTQAGRDFLLSLRKEINNMLQRIITSGVRETLNPETLYKIIVEIIKSYCNQQKGDIVIMLKKDDLESLEKRFLDKLKEETKKGVILKTSEDIRGGFTISFDSGKSCYDFSDRSISEYIGQHLKPKLNEILKGASSA